MHVPRNRRELTSPGRRRDRAIRGHRRSSVAEPTKRARKGPSWRRDVLAPPDLTYRLVGLGCNNFGMKLDERQSAEVVHAALEAGITHFDTAESYGGGRSEVFLGKALGDRRGDVVVATKFAARPKDEPYRAGALRRRILEGCAISLERLGTDHIDIYYQHHPDPEAPAEEALEALSELVAAGKVAYAACSNLQHGADRRGFAHLRRDPHSRLHSLSDPLEPSGAGGGGKARPCSSPAGDGGRSLFPAGVGSAHRQVPGRSEAIPRALDSRPCLASRDEPPRRPSPIWRS